MFRAIALGAFVLMLRIWSAFVPEEEYREKVAGIAAMEEKNQGIDLNGWTYEQIPSSDSSFTHRFYHYQSQKEDAPVYLFLHGLNLDGRTFLHLDELSYEYELVAYDLPEQSPWYTGDYDDFIRVISDFIDQKKIADFRLMGVSFGGGLALRLAALRKDLHIRDLVLASIAISEQSEVRNEMTEWLSHQPDYKIYWFVEQLYNRTAGNYVSDSLKPSVKDILRIKHPSYYRQISASLGDYNAVADAKGVDIPVLLLMGSQDRLFSVEKARETIGFFSDGTLKVIDGGTHSMVFTRAPEIADYLVAFSSESDSLKQVSKTN